MKFRVGNPAKSTHEKGSYYDFLADDWSIKDGILIFWKFMEGDKIPLLILPPSGWSYAMMLDEKNVPIYSYSLQWPINEKSA